MSSSALDKKADELEQAPQERVKFKDGFAEINSVWWRERVRERERERGGGGSLGMICPR